MKTKRKDNSREVSSSSQPPKKKNRVEGKRTDSSSRTDQTKKTGTKSSPSNPRMIKQDRQSSPSDQKKKTTGASSPLSTRVVKQERQSQRRHAEVVSEAKNIWNKLRMKTNSADENRQLMNSLMPLIEGKICQIALQHDASRTVQAAIQFGTPEERQRILKELCAEPGNLMELCKSQYAHFIVLKAVKHCHTNEVCRKLILKGLKGHASKLAVHAVGSRVIESLFTNLTPKQSALLKQEFYGPHFALFGADAIVHQKVETTAVPTLVTCLAAAPDKNDVTLDFVRKLLNKGMEKSLYGLTYFQELLAEYVGVATANEIRSITTLAADHVIHLLSTRPGTRVAATFVAYGTAKDRKRIMKSLKGYARSGLVHRDAYLAILRLIQLTDDTVSIHKNVLNEILTNPQGQSSEKDSPLLDLALSETAYKLFVLFLTEDRDAQKKYFDPYEQSLLFLDPLIEEDGMQVSTSKKNSETRRKELLKYLREPLIELCSKHTEQLLRSRPGCSVLREVYCAFHPDVVVKAIVRICQGALSNEREENSPVPLFEDACGHLAIKNLLLLDGTAKALPDPSFAQEFFNVVQDRLADIATTNRGSFVVSALCQVPSLRQKAISALKSQSKQLKQILDEIEGPKAGLEALWKELQ